MEGIVARSGDPAALLSFLAAYQLAYPYEVKLLEVATVVDQGSQIDAQGSTPRISVVTNQAGQHIYHSGNKSNDFESFAGSAIWKDTLANSRYLYSDTVNGSIQSFVGSADKVLGPFDKVQHLSWVKMPSKSAYLVAGDNNHSTRIYVDGQQIEYANSWQKLTLYGDELFSIQTENNTTFNQLADVRAQVAALLDTKVVKDKEKYELLFLRNHTDQWFYHGATKTPEMDIAWDLSGRLKEGEQCTASYGEKGSVVRDCKIKHETPVVSWSWLVGAVDYQKGTLSIAETNLELPKDATAIKSTILKSSPSLIFRRAMNAPAPAADSC